MTTFILNRDEITVQAGPGTVLLDAVRCHAGLTGTKEGCREGDCGACLVLVGERAGDGVLYRPVNSCLFPLGDVAGRHVVTIEGLNGPGLSPVQQAFVAEGATQCGFCTPGFIVALAGFLLSGPSWDETAAVDAVGGNLCRCTGYLSILRAVRTLCAGLADVEAPPPTSRPRLEILVDRGLIPEYFLAVALVGEVDDTDLSTASGRGGVAVAGGTDAFVQRPEELAEATLDLLGRRAELRGVRVADGRCVIGAATPVADLEDDPALRTLIPGVEEFFKLFSSRPIRHRATLGGNIANASPIGDLSILLLALDASLTLAAGDSHRELELSKLFVSYKKLAKQPGELIAAVSFAIPPAGAVVSFEKVCRRTHLDIASVNSAMCAIREGDRLGPIHLSAGGVAPVPLSLARTATLLSGATLDAALVRKALETAQAEISPISDVRGSADYKRTLLRQLLLAHILKLAPELEPEVAA